MSDTTLTSVSQHRTIRTVPSSTRPVTVSVPCPSAHVVAVRIDASNPVSSCRAQPVDNLCSYNNLWHRQLQHVRIVQQCRKSLTFSRCRAACARHSVPKQAGCGWCAGSPSSASGFCRALTISSAVSCASSGNYWYSAPNSVCVMRSILRIRDLHRDK